MLMNGRNQHNIVKQLSSNLKKNKKKNTKNPISLLSLLNILLESRKPILMQRIPQSCEGRENSDL